MSHQFNKKLTEGVSPAAIGIESECYANVLIDLNSLIISTSSVRDLAQQDAFFPFDRCFFLARED